VEYHDGDEPSLSDREIKQVSQIHKLLTASINDQNQPSTHPMAVDSDDNKSNVMDIDDQTGTTAESGTDMTVDDATSAFDSLFKKLVRRNLKALLFICLNEIQEYAGAQNTEAHLANALVEWVST
jgi:hypothetical protein